MTQVCVSKMLYLSCICLVSLQKQTLKPFQAMESAPRSLDHLLNTLKMEVKDLEDLDNFITNQTWIKKFYQFLENRQLEDHMQTLKFLITLTLLENLQSKQSKVKPKTQDFKVKILTEIFEKYFNEDTYILPLSNEKLQEKLLSFEIKSGKFDENQFKTLLEAKKDPTIWHEGLEPIYLKFLSSTSPSFVACLLSIL